MGGNLGDKANALPRSPGVYIMTDKRGEVIYVGKALSLKNRVSSYFHGAHNAKTELMVSKIADFDVIIANSEFEALVLENQLIKHHMPRYNIRLRDDKGHPYIRVDTSEEYPRFTVASKTREDGAKYMGPYASRGVAHAAIDAASKAFGLPTCTRRFPRDIGRERPCLNRDLGACRGWCLPTTDSGEYTDAVASAIRAFNGHAEKIIGELSEKMEHAAEEMLFEQAAVLRDRLRAVREMTKRQVVVSGASADTDAVGFYRGAAKSCFVVLHYIEGKLLDKSFELFDTPLEDDGDAISVLLRQYYSRRGTFPRTILLSTLPPDGEALELLFTEGAGHRVELAAPQRGDKRKLVETAEINAREESERASTREEKVRRTIEWLQRAMALELPPVRMEAYDISNTGADNIVASMTVFENGKPKKGSYRRFAIKSIDTPDDYRSMEEVITRRTKRFLDGDSGFSPLPDVMLIDGGASHAGVARRALEQLGVVLPVFGMVKDDRHRTRALVTPEGREIGIAANPVAFALIGTIQEETHRFAIEFHRERRSKSVKKSKLDEIPGVGAKRRTALQQAFGTLAAISNAELAALEQVVPKPTAAAVYTYFHPSPDDDGKSEKEGDIEK